MHGSRSRASPTSEGGLLRMRSELFLTPSVQRFHLDDGCAVIVADPERARALRIVDMDTPNIGRVRQLIFRILAALDIKSRHAIGKHGTGPCLAATAGLCIIGRPP